MAGLEPEKSQAVAKSRKRVATFSVSNINILGPKSQKSQKSQGVGSRKRNRGAAGQAPAPAVASKSTNWSAKNANFYRIIG